MFHVTGGQNMRDQITSDSRSKRAWSKSVLCIPSLLLRRFVFRMAEASAKRVTGDTPQGTMGRVQTAGEAPARSCVVFLAKKSFSWHDPIFGLFKSWKRSILVAYCCKHCKLWVDRWMAQNFKTWCRNNRQAAKESDSAGFLRIEDLWQNIWWLDGIG